MARRSPSSATTVPSALRRTRAAASRAENDESAGVARLQRESETRAEARTAAPADQLLVDYSSQPTIRLHLAGSGKSAGRLVLEGTWQVEVQVDQIVQPLDRPWRCVCWNSDEEGDYLELQTTTSTGIIVARQCLLSRKEAWALLAIKVTGARGERVDAVSILQTPAGIAPGEDGTRELRLAGSPLVRMFPLGLPQSTLTGCAGSFSAEGASLRLHQACAGTGVYVPLLLDWTAAHRRAAATWRTLTVTEDGRMLAGAEAAGHRLQVGSDQILLYHAVQPAFEARAVLGHNTRYETFVGRFAPNGDVDQILAIEPDVDA